MQNLVTNTIIAQAILLGFDFSLLPASTTNEELNTELLNFFMDGTQDLETIEAECEVNPGRQQSVIYEDYECYGEIVDFSAHWHKPAGTKVYHSDYITVDKDGKVKRMKLYYLVGETEYNTEKKLAPSYTPKEVFYLSPYSHKRRAFWVQTKFLTT